MNIKNVVIRYISGHSSFSRLSASICIFEDRTSESEVKKFRENKRFEYFHSTDGSLKVYSKC